MKKSIAIFVAFAMLVSSMVAFSNVAVADTGIPIEWVPGSDFYNTTYGEDYVIDTPGVLWENVNILIRGNLTINAPGSVTFRNCVLMVEGNVSINAGASLALEGTTLKIHNTFDGEHEIRVYTGGGMFLNDMDGNPVDNPAYPDSSHITANNTAFEFNLTVETGATFQMLRSRMSEAGWNNPNYGLIILADNTLVQDSYFTNCEAVYVEGDNVNLIGNFFYQNTYGIYVYMADDTNIQGNNFTEQSSEPVYLDLAENATVQMNEFWANTGSQDVYVDVAHNTQIIGNRMMGDSNPNYAVYADGDYNILIDGNTMDDYSIEAIYIVSSVGTISNNLMTGSGYGVEPNDSKLTISNNVMVGTGGNDGIDVYSNADLTIFDNTISNFGSGIYCDNNDADTNFTAYDNYIFDCTNGILIDGSEKPHMIYDNDISKNTVGISMLDSDNVTIVYNTMNFNTNGIAIDSLCNNTDVYNNSIASSGINGLDNALPGNNSWEFNYYSNYNGIDNGTGDFIGDTNLPYTVNGLAGETDGNPRTKITTSINNTWTYAMVSVAVNNVDGTTIYVPGPTPNAGSRTLPQVGVYYDANMAVDGFDSFNVVGDGMDWSFIDGNSAGDIFDITNTNDTLFQDLSLMHGTTAIDIDDDTNVVILGCNISENSADGVELDYSNSDGEFSKMHISDYELEADNPWIAVDGNDNVHIVWSSDNDDGDDYTDIVYKMYDNNGNILIDETIITAPDGGDKARRPRVAVDSFNMAHVVWFDHANDSMCYIKLNPYLDDMNGDAADLMNIMVVLEKRILDDTYDPMASEVDMKFDDNDNLYIVWFEDGGSRYGLQYMKLDVNGNILYGPTSYFDYIGNNDGSISYIWRGVPSVAFDSNNDVHVVWSDYYPTGDDDYSELHYAMFDGATGAVMIDRTKVTAFDNDKSTHSSIVIDSKDMIHVIYQDKGMVQDNEIAYLKLDPSQDDQDGDWANVMDIKVIPEKALTYDDNDKSVWPYAEIDSQDNIHIAYYEDFSNGDPFYMKIDEFGNIIEKPRALALGWYASSNGYITRIVVDVDSNDQPHVVWRDDRCNNARIAYMPPNDWTGFETRTIEVRNSNFFDNAQNGFDYFYDTAGIALDVVFENCEFFSQAGHSIRVAQNYVEESNFIVNNCDFYYETDADTSDYHIYFADIEDGLYFNASITNCNFAAVTNADGGGGIYDSDGFEYFTQYASLYVDSCTFETMNYGYYGSDYWYANMDFVFTNNYFEDISSTAIYWYGNDYLNNDEEFYIWTYNVQVNDNEFWDIGSECLYIEYLYGNSGFIQFNNNYIIDADDGFYLYYVYGDTQIEVNYNYMEYMSTYGIYFYEWYYGEYLYMDIIGNTLIAEDGESCDGIYLDDVPYYSNIAYVTINDNYITGMNYAICINNPYYGNAIYVDMDNNDIIACEYALYIDYIDECDVYLTMTNSYIAQIGDTVFHIDDCCGPYNAEFLFENIQVYGYDEYGLYIDEMPEYGVNWHVEFRNCEFYSTPEFEPECFIYTDYNDEGQLIIDVYDTTVIGWWDTAIYCDGDDSDYSGYTVVNVYDSYFEDYAWPDVYGSYFLYGYYGSVFFNIYNTVGLDSAYFEYDYYGTSRAQWFELLDIQVYTGAGLDIPATNVNIDIYDLEGGHVAGGVTDANGQLSHLWLKSHSYLRETDNNQHDYWTPHTVVADNGAAAASVNIDMFGGPKQVTLYLTGDWDGDGQNDLIDPDDDNDGIVDNNDAFPNDPAESADSDGDGIGDNADMDDDNDGIPDTNDTYPTDPFESTDTDGDGIGDIYDWDIDGDDVGNNNDAFPYDGTEWNDMDGDGTGDNTDWDIDGDGFNNTAPVNETAPDDFPYDGSEWNDMDGDGVGDNSDWDMDGDGIGNDQDEFPADPTETSDMDGDGIGDNADTDVDGDGIPDADDDFPTNPNEWGDSDGDGVGDNSDWDIDGDGVANPSDDFPYGPADWRDLDGDGLGDGVDTDMDGDGVANADDAFPFDIDEWVDTDGDGLGDNKDWDADGDGVANAMDDFPFSSTEWRDTDGDGIGNNEDTDDDGDGILDADDAAPLFFNEPATVIPEYPEFPEDQPDIPLYLLLLILIVTMVLVLLATNKVKDNTEPPQSAKPETPKSETPEPKAEEPKVDDTPEEPPKPDSGADLTEE